MHEACDFNFFIVKVKDFSRSQTVTHTVKVVLLRKNCNKDVTTSDVARKFDLGGGLKPICLRKNFSIPFPFLPCLLPIYLSLPVHFRFPCHRRKLPHKIVGLI